MDIGIYGGSFNPVHFGHIGLAQWTVQHTDLDELWMLVTPSNPLKDPNILADEQQRLHAVEQAILQSACGNVVKASDFEFHLPRPSYTANTLRQLQLSYPQHRFTLIIGEDNVDIFPRWREYEYILDHFRIFVYPRRGSQGLDSIRTLMDTDQSTIRNIVYLHDAPYFDVSSTQLRTQQ